MIKIAKLQHYQSVLIKHDLPVIEMLEDTGISLSDLNLPDLLITHSQFQKTIENIIKLTGDPAFGLRCGQQLSLLDMGLSGFALHSSKSLRDALNAWFTYSLPVYGDIIRAKVVEHDDHWSLDASIGLPLSIAYQFCIDEFLMLCQHTGASVHSDKKLVYHHIHLPTRSHTYASEYKELFKCPVLFNMPDFSIGVTYPNLDAPIHSEPEAYQRLYSEFCTLMNQETQHYGAVSLLVRNELIKSPDQLPSVAMAAKALHCSERTLKRKLQLEGTNFRSLINEFRCELATHYLTKTGLSVKQIAYQLGYTDSKPFQRAFKSWVGIAPGIFRQNQ